MPFDERDFPAGDRRAPAADRGDPRWVAGWLFIVAAMIFVMVVLGGVTRLTGSGLSIMEWAPLSGTLPPLSTAEWERLFDLYKQIPQYALLHAGFGLAEFKGIFWLEWTHRLWGRLLGFVFFVPLVVFIARKMIPRPLIPRLALFFVLGGLQGAAGWFMVASGFFPDSTAVSPYRLVIHLGLALALYAAVLWTGLSLWPYGHAARIDGSAARTVRRATGLVLALVTVTVVAGGFVAGLHAGLDYNTFPLMEGSLVPPGYARLDPFWRNLTENIAAVQFDHRLLATLTALSAVGVAVIGLRARARGILRAGLVALLAAVILQYSLGVATLLNAVPVGLAAAHQATAVVLLTAALLAYHSARRDAAV
jgi:cytochrome c oxidase assembly protein subunit 15